MKLLSFSLQSIVTSPQFQMNNSLTFKKIILLTVQITVTSDNIRQRNGIVIIQTFDFVKNVLNLY